MPGTQCRIEDATIVTRVFMYCGSVVSGLSSSCLAQTTPLASRFMNTFHGHNIPHEFELWFDSFVDVGRGTRASSFIGSRSRELEHGLNDMHGRPLVLWVCVRGLEWRFENPHMTTVPWTRSPGSSSTWSAFVLWVLDRSRSRHLSTSRSMTWKTPVEPRVTIRANSSRNRVLGTVVRACGSVCLLWV